MANTDNHTSVILDPFHRKLLLRLRRIAAKKMPEVTVSNTLIFRLGLHALRDKWEKSE